MEDVGDKVSRLIEQHEYDYLQAYNIFVKRKEVELRDFEREAALAGCLRNLE